MIGTSIMLLTIPIAGELSTLMDEAKKEFFTKKEIIEMLGDSVVNVCQKMNEIKKKEDDQLKKEIRASLCKR